MSLGDRLGSRRAVARVSIGGKKGIPKGRPKPIDTFTKEAARTTMSGRQSQQWNEKGDTKTSPKPICTLTKEAS
jgi:hypothetical protein